MTKPKNETPEITIVIPVYNEAGLVVPAAEELVERLQADGVSFELILAENGSTDGTAALLADLEARLAPVRALHLDRPDYGAALRMGILEARGKYVVCEEIDICDVDFHRRALSLLRDDDADFIVGSKAARGSGDHRPIYRRAATRVMSGLLRAGLGFRGTDTHGLKAFHRLRVRPVVERCVVTRDLFASELVIRAQRMGLRVQEIPVDIQEKRPPSVQLIRRVPGVFRNLGELIWVIRVKGE
ncbi:MAG: glycosyltransferase [Deltaproteobacteria bacterium]|nr:glycosyltransferase [Deltaproteobacteria bacterium]